MAERRSIQELDRGIRELTKTLRGEPDNAALLVERGRFYFERFEAYFESKDISRAEQDCLSALDDYERAVALNPGDTSVLAAAHYGRGSAAFVRGRTFRRSSIDRANERAIADYEAATRLDSSLASRRNTWYAIAYSNRGWEYLNEEEYGPALEDYNRAISLDTGDTATYICRGSIYFRTGEYDLALNDYDRAISLNPRDAAAYHNRALAYWAKGEGYLALKDFDRALKLNSGDADAYNARGNAYVNIGEYDLAIKDYDWAICLNPDHVAANRNRTLAYRSKVERDNGIALKGNVELSGISQHISELFGLTDSGDASAAANAAAEAQDLLDEYNLCKHEAIAQSEGRIGSSEITAARYVFYVDAGSVGMYTPRIHHSAKAGLIRIWGRLMNPLSEHCFCQSFGDGDILYHSGSEYASMVWFIVVGDPINVAATIDLFKWRKKQLEGEIERQWPLFQNSQRSLSREAGHFGKFRDNFLAGAVPEIELAMKECRQRSGREADLAIVADMHRAAIRAAIDEGRISYTIPRREEQPQSPPPGPRLLPATPEDYDLAKLMGRRTGETMRETDRNSWAKYEGSKLQLPLQGEGWGEGEI